MWAKHKQSGFTIVELLIVIVVIAILAAISIVAYNGIQARSNTAAAESAADTVAKKAHAANLVKVTPGYPMVPAAFNANPESTLVGTGIRLAAISTSAPSTVSTVEYVPCGADGAQISYWDYTAGSKVTSTVGNPGTCTTAFTWGPL